MQIKAFLASYNLEQVNRRAFDRRRCGLLQTKYAALAEKERAQISARTKAALAALKARAA